jgi:hypothetical protein
MMILFPTTAVSATPLPGSPDHTIEVPHNQQCPQLEDFLDMAPQPKWEGKLARISDFVQRSPKDGEPVTEPTHVYLCYDDASLHVVFVAFDSQPSKIRARMTRREDIFGDDNVELILDTFHDRRRAYSFGTNAFGVQIDSLWTEGSGYDDSFDTVWHSKGKITERGFVVWMAIPFRSLRFPSNGAQSWGIQVSRFNTRTSEDGYWPQHTARIEGRLNQAGTLRGLQNISPGRNIQLIPYGVLRSFRALDTRDPAAPRFESRRAEVDGGLDGKFILRDSLVFDVTVNPDFSQVESDEPQVTLNQRFEVFFPEKRPFFIENASYFQTPINLLFTRRIADPQFGLRVTGKAGRYAVGALLVDDESPGKIVPPMDPSAGKRGMFGVLRVSRDIFDQSNIGFIFADREFHREYNRVGGIDARFKVSPTWVASLQGVASATRLSDGTRLAGPAYQVGLVRQSLHFNYSGEYTDRSPGFVTESGFVPRTDIRATSQRIGYDFRPEAKLISWGPRFWADYVWDHQGTRLDSIVNPWFQLRWQRGTELSFAYTAFRERLRPQDFPTLAGNIDLPHHDWTVSFRTSYLSKAGLDMSLSRGRTINFTPALGQAPFVARWTRARVGVPLRPWTRLRIENTYLLNRLTDLSTGANIFNDHILRTKWNFQYNRQLSFRAIVQYNAVLRNDALTSLEQAKNVNFDFLITYLVHPGTALFLGYNSNLQNLDPSLALSPSGLLRTRNPSTNDSRQLFAKLSYQFRF